MYRRGVKNFRGAFSLIELVVVMGIATASIAILVPAIGKAHQSFQLSRCRNNARFVTQSILTYAGEHRQKFVPDYREPALASLTGGPGRTAG